MRTSVRNILIGLGCLTWLSACTGGDGDENTDGGSERDANRGGASAGRDDAGIELEDMNPPRSDDEVDRCADARVEAIGPHGWTVFDAPDGDHFTSSCGGAGGLDAVARFVPPTTGRWRFTLERNSARPDGHLALFGDCRNAGTELACEPGSGELEVDLQAGDTVFAIADELDEDASYVVRAGLVHTEPPPDGCNPTLGGADCGANARCADPDADGRFDCVSLHAPVIARATGYWNPDVGALGLEVLGDDPEADVTALHVLALDALGNGRAVHLQPGVAADRRLNLSRDGTTFTARAALALEPGFEPAEVEVTMVDRAELQSDPVRIADFEAPERRQDGEACDIVGGLDTCADRSRCIDAGGGGRCVGVTPCGDEREVIELIEQGEGWSAIGDLGAGGSTDQGSCGGWGSEQTFLFAPAAADFYLAEVVPLRGAGSLVAYARAGCGPAAPELACAAWQPRLSFEAGPGAPVFITVDSDLQESADYVVTVRRVDPPTIFEGEATYDPATAQLGVQVEGRLGEGWGIGALAVQALDAAERPLPGYEMPQELWFEDLGVVPAPGFSGRTVLNVGNGVPSFVRVAARDQDGLLGPFVELQVGAPPVLALGDLCGGASVFGHCADGQACGIDRNGWQSVCQELTPPVLDSVVAYLNPATHALGLRMRGADAGHDTEGFVLELLDARGRVIPGLGGEYFVGDVSAFFFERADWLPSDALEASRAFGPLPAYGVDDARIVRVRVRLVDRLGGTSEAVEADVEAPPELARGADCDGFLAFGACAPTDYCQGARDFDRGRCALAVPPVIENVRAFHLTELGQVGISLEVDRPSHLLSGLLVQLVNEDGEWLPAQAPDFRYGSPPEADGFVFLVAEDGLRGSRGTVILTPERADARDAVGVRVAVVDADQLVSAFVEVPLEAPPALEAGVVCEYFAVFGRCEDGLYCDAEFASDPNGRCVRATIPEIVSAQAILNRDGRTLRLEVVVDDDDDDPYGVSVALFDAHGEPVDLARDRFGLEIRGVIDRAGVWFDATVAHPDGTITARAHLNELDLARGDIGRVSTVQVAVVDAYGVRSDVVELPVTEPPVRGVDEPCDVSGQWDECDIDLVCLSEVPWDQTGRCIAVVAECPADWPVENLNDARDGDVFRIVGDNFQSALEFGGTCGQAGPGEVYTFEPEVEGIHVFETTDIVGDTVLLVRSHCALPGLDFEFACDDDGGGNLASRASARLVAGERVYVIVQGYGGQPVEYTLTVTPP